MYKSSKLIYQDVIMAFSDYVAICHVNFLLYSHIYYDYVNKRRYQYTDRQTDGPMDRKKKWTDGQVKIQTCEQRQTDVYMKYAKLLYNYFII